MEAQDHGVDVHELRAQRRAERKAAEARQRRERGDVEDPRIRLLDGEDLLEIMEERARAAVKVS